MGSNTFKSRKIVLSVILVTVLLVSSAIFVSAEAATKRSSVKSGISAPIFKIFQPTGSDVSQTKASGSDISVNGGNTILPVNNPTLSITAPSEAVTFQSVTWTMEAYADTGANIKSIAFYVDNSLQANYTSDFQGVFASCYGIGLDHATCFATEPTISPAGTYTYYAVTVDNLGRDKRDPLTGTKSIVVSNSNPLEIRMMGNGQGAILFNETGADCGTSGNYICKRFPIGKAITMTAYPAVGSEFSMWKGWECTGKKTASCSTSVSFTHGNDYAAVFSKTGTGTYPLMVWTGNAPGTITSSPAGINCANDCVSYFPANQQVTLTATPAAGNRFERWYIDCANATGNTCSITMNSAKLAGADFKVNGPALAVSHTPDYPTINQQIEVYAVAGGSNAPVVTIMELYIDNNLVNTCYFDQLPNVEVCRQFGSYPTAGPHTYYARALDTNSWERNPLTGTKSFFVSDGQAPSDVTGLGETARGDSWIYWQWTNPADADFDHVEVWLNNTFRVNTAGTFYNATGLTPSTGYEIEVRPADTSGNIGSWTNDSARTLPPGGDITPPGPVTGLAETAVGINWINWAWTNPTDADFNHVEVWLNETFVANTALDNYNVTGLNPDTGYEVQIRPVDNVGNIGIWTNDSARTLQSPNTLPVITLLTPANNTVWNSTLIDHRFRVIDSENATVNCNAYYNSTLKMALPNTNAGGTTVGFPVTQNTNGIFDWYITCNDGIGTSTSELWRIYVNAVGTPNTAPSITVTSPANNSVQSLTTLTVGFAISDNEQVAGNVQLYVDGILRNSVTAIVNTPTTISASGLGLGAHTFYVRVSDGALSATSGIYDFTIVTPPQVNTPPVIYIVNATNNTITNSLTWTASFYYIDQENLTHTCGLLSSSGGQGYTLNNNTILTVNFTLIEGSNYWYVRCEDAPYGVVGLSEIYYVTRDTIPPVITYDSFMPINQTITGAPAIYAYVNISEAVPAAVLEINGVNVTMSNAVGSWWGFWALGLPNGNYTYKVYATDLAGNTGSSYEAWTYINATNDNTAPGNITNLNETAVGLDWINWAWTNPGDGDLNHIYILANGNFLLNLSSWNTSEVNVTGLSPDTIYTISVQPVDVFGNRGNFTNDSARTLAPSGTGGGGGGGGEQGRPGGGGGGSTPPTVTGYVLEVPPNVTIPEPTPTLARLTLSGDSVIEVTAGVPFELVLDLANDGGINDYYAIEIINGPEWIVLHDKELSIAEGETKQFRLTITAPLETADESFPLRIMAYSVNNEEIFTTYDLTVNVKGQAAAGAFVTGFVSLVSGRGLAALLGVLLLAALFFLYWRSLPEARKAVIKHQFGTTLGRVRNLFVINGKNGAEKSLVKSVTDEVSKGTKGKSEPNVTGMSSIESLKAAVAPKIDWAPKGTEHVLQNLDNIRGEFHGTVSEAKSIKARISGKPAETSKSVAEKIALIKDPGLLESLKKDVEKQ